MLTGAQVRMARAALGWSIRDLSQKTGVSERTIKRLEQGGTTYTSTLSKIQRALEAEGLEFIPESRGAGVKFRE
jgi:transcriptional regulator with XRE-family HTH domain